MTVALRRIGGGEFVAGLCAMIAIAMLIGLVHAVHASFPLAQKWADSRIAAGLVAPEARASLVQAVRGTYGARDADGDWLPYPIGADSYYYLRLAERIVETGSPCADAIAAPCRDELADAPAGRPMADARAPHPWALALAHGVLAAFDPDRSLIATARVYSAVLLAVLGALVFAFGRLMTGPGVGGLAAGFVAAATACLHPVVIERTFGADDDVWTLILITGGTYLAARMLTAARPAARAAFGAGAGIACGTLGASWGGWPFLPAMILATAGVMALAMPVRAIRRSGGAGEGLLAIAQGVGATVAALAAVAWALDVGIDLPAVTAEASRLLGGAIPAGPLEAPAPDTFAFVSELRTVSMADGFAGIGWPVVAFAGLGIALLVVRLHPATLTDRPSAAAAILALAWLAGALALLPTAERYSLLLAPPVALLAGAGLGRVIALASRFSPRAAVAAGAVIAIAWGGALTERALTQVADNRPSLTSAWVLALTRLREASTDEALVLSWWDVGHRIAFWSRRPVAVDGASLRSPRTHAIGRLFAADGDRPVTESLRAAACVDGGRSCPRGDVFLVVSLSLLASEAWMSAGLWDPSRARLVDAAAAGVERGALGDAAPAGVENGEALRDAYDAAARAVGNRLERARFAAPQARIWSPGWQTCGVEPSGAYRCPLGLTGADGWTIEDFSIDPARPDDAQFRVRRTTGDASGPVAIPPSSLRVATDNGLFQVRAARDGDTNPGVLFDGAKGRVFVGTPAIVRSLVVRLVLLEGRYDRSRFAPVASFTSIDGETVQVWKAVAKPSPDP